MRKILVSLLLASAAATPAIAGPRDSADRQQAREERQQAREERQAEREVARPDRSSERPSFAAPNRSDRSEQLSPRREAVDRPQLDRAERTDRRGFDGNALRAERQLDRDAAAVRQSERANQRGQRFDSPSERIEQVQQRFEQRQDARQERRDLRASDRATPNVMRDRNPLIVSRTPRAGTQPPLRAEARPTPAVQWSTNWRHNDRYDWQNHRRRHRSLFHLGFYFDPFGWGYYPYQIGWRLWPSYYSSRYWINDPWMYRLPYAPIGYRWVRYWNDALLVDTWTGEVVDVIPGFFW